MVAAPRILKQVFEAAVGQRNKKLDQGKVHHPVTATRPARRIPLHGRNGHPPTTRRRGWLEKLKEYIPDVPPIPGDELP
jgi:hypothetical protein